ncbi:Crp/Fnr family transcriptional regulator [Rhodoferax aquaticus]|uniref:Crp/Fnr family transcriptional regulator n=1 Tax=Rhodoferax aquaticus TaxID=2527691 RepID=A0A515EJ73_9BURK|nr:Crp/Fnr family transcriptional regulator [Rhodoferax aquaticus]QDL52714.1 Crp/Fnr family transcriptional regulator [Rhodoferax aquaticus]
MHSSKPSYDSVWSANPWFAALPAAEKKALMGSTSLAQLKAGDVLLRKGTVGGGFYGVLSGRLKVSSVGEDGREAVLSVLEPGTWFGETALLDGLPRTHDVSALAACELLAVSAGAFARLMGRSPFARAIALQLATRNRALYGLVEDAMLRSTATRIARRLLVLARGDASMLPQARSSLTVSQEALSLLLGLTRQTLSKELKQLEREGVLSLGYGRIEIVSLPALEARCALA